MQELKKVSSFRIFCIIFLISSIWLWGCSGQEVSTTEATLQPVGHSNTLEEVDEHAAVPEEVQVVIEVEPVDPPPSAGDGIHEPLKQRAPLDFTQEEVDELVAMEQVSIYSPAPKENGEPPEECDYIKFLRFKLRDSNYDPEDVSTYTNTDAFLLMAPGILEGANGFEYIARNLVYIAKEYNLLNVEVWAMDRRNNCLEDTSMEEYLEQIYYEGHYKDNTYTTVEEKHDGVVDLAIAYIYEGEVLPNGKKFAGFLKNKDVPYLSEFGLKLDTEDMFSIIMKMVPDLEVRQKKVFVGGHSLGGIHTSMFAGWDLDGDPETLDDAGYMNCAGIFCFDSTVAATSEVIQPFVDLLPVGIKDLIENMTEGVYQLIVGGLRTGLFPPLLPFPFFDAEIMAITELVGCLADWFPDHEFTAIHKIPMNWNLETTIQLLHSRTAEQFLQYNPTMKDFRYTYETLVGALFDDSMSPVGMIQTSLGHLYGGPVVRKNFPIPDVLQDIPVLSDFLGAAFSTNDLYIPADEGVVDEDGNGPLYTWANFDEIGNADDPVFQNIDGTITYTTMESELVDMQDFARALHIGPSNLVEWYFSTRPIIDIMAATLSYGPKYGLNFIHKDKVDDLPIIEFVGDEGVVASPIIQALLPGEPELLKGVNHMDPMFMSANTSSHRENEIIQPLIDFVVENSGE